MKNKKQLGELTEIEMLLIMIRNLFTDLFQQMVMSSKGLMGFPVNSSQLKAMAAFHEDRRYSMGELCKLARVKMPCMTEVVDRLVAEGFVERIRDFTGDGVDVVLDPVGGARHVWRSNRALRKGGRLVWFGMAATKKGGLKVIPFTLLMVALLKLIPDGKQAPLAPDLSKDNAWYRETLAELLDLLAAGKIKPVVAARIPLLGAVRAHELLERGGYAGKVVLMAGT